MFQNGDDIAWGNRGRVFRRAEKEFGINVRKLRDPLADVDSLGIKSLGLSPGILDAEVGCGIGPGAGAPLPAPVIGGDLAIEEMLGEELFTQAPIEVEILGEKHGYDHANPVVHESGVKEFANSGVDNRKAGMAGFPGYKLLSWFVPGKSPPIGVEFHLKHVGEVMEDLEVEFSPSQLF